MLKLFLVDDSVYIRQRLTRMLAQLKGVEIVGQATEASQAIQAILHLKPDVVLLDIGLAGEATGINVLQNVKQKKSTPVVIVLTNYPYQEYQRKCLDAGADFFFDKSTQFERVVPVIEQLLKKKKHRRNSAGNGRGKRMTAYRTKLHYGS